MIEEKERTFGSPKCCEYIAVASATFSWKDPGSHSAAHQPPQYEHVKNPPTRILVLGFFTEDANGPTRAGSKICRGSTYRVPTYPTISCSSDRTISGYPLIPNSRDISCPISPYHSMILQKLANTTTQQDPMKMPYARPSHPMQCSPGQATQLVYELGNEGLGKPASCLRARARCASKINPQKLENKYM
jgi:hypothetical protein